MTSARFVTFFVLLLALSAWVQATPPTPPPTSAPAEKIRFVSIDVFIDPQGKPLGAYQVEFKSTRGDIKLVGVEGGVDQAFKTPPYYDPKALQQARIILAAFSTDSSLPTTRTRVARLHVQVRGEVVPEYELKLMIAGDREAKPIPAAASFTTDTEK